MPRLNPVDPATAPPAAAEILADVKKTIGMVPNIMATMAHSPASLKAYLDFGGTLGGASLSGKVREQIAVTVAGANGCEYCASAHTLLGKKQGVGDDEIARNLDADSSDPKTKAALAFSRALVVKRGWASDEDLQAVRAAGYTDAEIVEIIATVAINTFTNYFNHIAQTENDFPAVAVGEPVTA